MQPAPTAVIAALGRLRAAADSGALDELCRRHGIRVLTVFGSAARGDVDPHDLDVGVLSEPGALTDVVSLVTDLIDLAGTDALDVAHLNGAGPVIKERALVGSIGLYESERGAWTRAAMAASTERMDTRWMRDLDLALMAGTAP